MPPELPGFYFDPLKNKYFAVQKGAPESAAYSSQDVKRRRLNEERSMREAAQAKRQILRIRHAQILENQFSSGFLLREQGQTHSFNVSNIFASGLIPQPEIHAPESQFPALRNPLFAIEPRRDLGASIVDFQIAQDHGTFGIRADVDDNSPSREDFPETTWTSENWEGPTSIATHHASRRHAITWYSSSTQHGIAIIPVEDSGPMIILGPGPWQSRGLRAGNVTMYCSAAANQPSSLLFVFGSSHGVLNVDKTRLDLRWTSRVTMPDVWAVEFQQEKDDVILSGGRGGILHCNDFKDRRIATSASTIITHPSSVTHIRQLDTHRLLVAGLESSLCQYDLRYLKLDTEGRIGPGHHESLAHAGPSPKLSRPCTRPILQYLDYYNTATRELGFDIDLETGVIAAAQEAIHSQPPIRLFSLWGGHSLSSPALSKLYGEGMNANEGNIKCLRFGRDVDHRMKSLYFARGGSMQRLAWAEEEFD